jgi:hypothetical protein
MEQLKERDQIVIQIWNDNHQLAGKQMGVARKLHFNLPAIFPGQISTFLRLYTANEGPLRIQYKCLVPTYVFPEMKQLFPKQNYNVLSSSSYTHISERDLYISWVGLPTLQQENMWTDPWNI